MKRRTKTLLAATAVLAATLVTTPAAEASGSFYAGSLYSDSYQHGQTVGIFFTNYGQCDGAGYSVSLSSMALIGWNTKLSSVAASGQNGCNAMRIQGNSGKWYFYCGTPGCVANGNADWNDNAAKVNFYRNGRTAMPAAAASDVRVVVR